MNAPKRRYGHTAIALHWIIAVSLFGQWALGLWMMELPKTPPGLRAGWFNVHKSCGSLPATVLLHIAAAFKHAFVDKDGGLQSMTRWR